MPELSATEWDEFIACHPDAHLLQTGNWGKLKGEFGWDVLHLKVEGAAGSVGAQVLFRRLPFRFSLAYIPKGPIGEMSAQEPYHVWEPLWQEMDRHCHQRKAIFLKVEPDLWEPPSEGEQANLRNLLPPAGFQPSEQVIQPPRTLLVDLRGDEEQILGRMKQKTRYNIRLALKKGVVVSPSADLDTFYRLLTLTGRRDGFGVHALAYYQRAYELFHPRGECELLMAEYQGTPIAALMVFAHGSRAWYFYGASANEHREAMPSYLLQWEAMRWARNQGTILYDLWGVPDVDERRLEASFIHRSDGLWGVYRFKRGFGGELRRSLGPWDRVYQPLLYAFYRWLFSHRSQDR